MKRVPSIKKLRKKCGERHMVWIDILYRNISIYFTKAFLYTPLTPNQISVISILIGILGGIFLSIGKFWSFVLGGLFIIFYNTLDRVDGEVARYKKMTSFKGKYLEFLGYHYTTLFAYVGLIWGVYSSIGNVLVLLFGLLMILFNVLIKYAVNGIHIILLYDIFEKGKYNKYKKDLKDYKKFFPKKLRDIGWEINAFITCIDYMGFWIIIGAILDAFMPKIIIYSFSMSYLMLYILLQLFAGFIKLIVTLKMYLFSKKTLKM